MKIIVPVARILDPSARPDIDFDGCSLLSHGRSMVMNPFDEVALTAAICLKQAGKAAEIIAVGVVGKPPRDAEPLNSLHCGSDGSLTI